MNDLFGKHIWQILPGKPRVHFGQGEVVWSSEKVGTEGGHLSNINYIYQIFTTFIKYLLHLSNIYFQIFSFIKYLLNRICCIIKYLSERQFYEMSAWHHLWWNILFEHMLWNMYSRNCFQMADCLDNFILISCFRWPKERKFWSTNMQTTSKTRLWKLSQTNV